MTRAIILAAGFGSRLMPLTTSSPKGMVPLCGVPLLMRQISVLRAAGIHDITIVGGYHEEALYGLGYPVVRNAEYATTNMVESLMRARHVLDGSADILMCYGDIVYESRVLDTVLNTQADIAITADLGWEKLWSARMENYASDVETFKMRDGKIIELGKKPTDLKEVEAQYIGLVKFSAAVQSRILTFYDALDRAATYDTKSFDNMYMTSFLQGLIDAGFDVRPALITNGWLEVDTLEDHTRYEALQSEGSLAEICDLPAPTTLDALLKRPILFDASNLDMLSRKLEIVGTLHTSYQGTKPAGNVATPEEAAMLLAQLLKAFDDTNDYRYLNTVIKALGGTLKNPRPAWQAELEQLVAARLS